MRSFLFSVLFVLLPLVAGAQEICVSQTGNKYAPRCGVKSVLVPIVTDTNAYAVGDYINDENEITVFSDALGKGSLSGQITDVIIYDEGAEGKQLELWIFNDDPDGSTFTDNAAFTLVDADLTKVACVIPINTFYSAAANGVGVNHFPGCSIKGATVNLYAAIVAREAVTFDAVDAVSLRIVIKQD